MGYHPRIEVSDIASMTTSRTRNSELWFVNNKQLETTILSRVAKYSTRYEVTLYAFGIEGNHVHGLALYPQCNRSSFKRDLNSAIAKGVMKHVPTYSGGSLWSRRYSAELVPAPEDIEKQFFYIALQPVQDGLVDKLSDYPGYNFFHDAVCGIRRKFKVVRWTEYNSKARWNPELSIEDFTDEFELVYARLPGYEHLSQDEYKKLMYKKLEEHRMQVLTERDKPCAGRSALLATRPGARPKRTKTSTRTSHRPRVLSVCAVRREHYKAWYFDIFFRHKDASEEYRSGNLHVEFPPGTYKPPIFTCPAAYATSAL